MSRYSALSDEEKLETAISFIAFGEPLPEELKTFLVEVGLYELIVDRSNFGKEI